MFLEILSVEAFTEKYLYLEGLSDLIRQNEMCSI